MRWGVAVMRVAYLDTWKRRVLTSVEIEYLKLRVYILFGFHSFCLWKNRLNFLCVPLALWCAAPPGSSAVETGLHVGLRKGLPFHDLSNDHDGFYPCKKNSFVVCLSFHEEICVTRMSSLKGNPYPPDTSPYWNRLRSSLSSQINASLFARYISEPSALTSPVRNFYIKIPCLK